MGKPRKPFTDKQLSVLMEDVNSCITINNTTYSLALYPYHLTNVSESVKRLLNVIISKYDQRLDGILLGYKNLKLITPYASLKADRCYIHVDIQGDFYLFKPKVGSLLTGVVNRVSSNHIGCLVHNVFNVAVPKNEDESWAEFDFITKDVLGLCVTKMDLEGRLPYIQASIDSIISKNKNLTKRQKKARRLLNDNSDIVDNNNKSLLELSEQPENKLSKRQRRKRNNLDEELSQKTLILNKSPKKLSQELEKSIDTNKITPKIQIPNESQRTNESDYFATPKNKKKQKQTPEKIKEKTPESVLEKGSLEDFVPKEKKNKKRHSISADTKPKNDSAKKKKNKKNADINIEELQNTLLMKQLKSIEDPKIEKKRKSKDAEKSDQKPILSPVKPMADLEDRKSKKRRQSLSQNVNWANKELHLYDSDLEKTLNTPTDANNILDKSLQLNLAKIQALNAETPRKLKRKHKREAEDDFISTVKKTKNNDY